jgi:hypothetical protein
MIGGAASVFYFMPALRTRFVAFLQGSTASPSPSVQPAPQPAKSDASPPWMNYVPDETPPITAPSKSSPSDSSNNAASSSTFASAGNSNNSTTTAPPKADSTPLPAPVVTPAPPPAVAPTPAPAVATQTPNPAPPQSNDNPPAASSSNSGIASAAQTVAKLKQSCGDDLDSLSMKLRNSGLDAEARQDYASARYFYEQVEALPPDHWPSDIDRLLKNVVQKHFDNDVNH